MDPRCERGDIILGGLSRTVLGLVLLGLVVFELGAWATNVVQLDDLGERTVHAAAAALGDGGSRSDVERAALAVLSDHEGVTLRSMTVSAGAVQVVLTRTPDLAVADRIEPLRKRLAATVTKSARPLHPR